MFVEPTLFVLLLAEGAGVSALALAAVAALAPPGLAAPALTLWGRGG